MKSFAYAAPKTLQDALALLSDQWGDTDILAGGTDWVPCFKQGLAQPARLVSLKNVAALKGIEATTASVRIGAMTTLTELVENGTIQRHFPALITAAQGVGSSQILNIGTVGGDLCQRPRCWYFRNGFGLLAKEGDFSLVPHGDNRYHAIFGNEGPAYFVSASSFGPPLIALGATVTLAGPNGSRTIPVAQFFRTPQSEKERETALKPNEILTQIDIPVRGLRNATYEVRHRHGLDWPYVTASVAYAAKGGSAAEAQIALGHVAPTPWLATAAARLLEGPLVDAALAAKCGQTATQGAKPLSRNAYKVQMVQTSVKRAILAAAGA